MKATITLAQIKPTKGDYDANLARIGDLFEQIDRDVPQTDILALPETVLSGYFLEGAVREAARPAAVVFDDLLRTFRARCKRPGACLDICLGFYESAEGRLYNSALYGSLSVDDAGPARLIHIHRKFFLPTYGVFDEKRFVSSGRHIDSFMTRFGPAALLICEDVWHSVSATIAALKGAQILYIVSASPGREFSGKDPHNVARWSTLLPSIADEHSIWVAYCGLVGFEGGKGFTGSSQIIDPWGVCIAGAPVTDECLVTAEIHLDDVGIARAASPLLSDLESALGDITRELNEIALRPREPLAQEKPQA